MITENDPDYRMRVRWKRHDVKRMTVEVFSEAKKGKISALQAAWERYRRGDEMFRMACDDPGEPWSDKRRVIVLTACKCSREAREILTQESRKCFELFKRWAGGEDIKRGDLNRAQAVAFARPDNLPNVIDSTSLAIYLADYDDEWVFLQAGCVATYVANAAASAAAWAAPEADRRAAAAKASDEALARCADIVREFYPSIPVSYIDLPEPLPSEFTTFPHPSVLCIKADSVAQKIMVILARTGNTFRELTKQEYIDERNRESDFSDNELIYFNQVIPYCRSSDKAQLYAKVWID